MGIVPFYISWLLTSLLMINRDYGRPAVVLFCLGFGIGEGVTMIFFSMEEVNLVIMPETYTVAETLRVFRAFFPVLLTMIITLLDFTMDRLPDNPTDPLFIMKKILAA